MHSSVVLRAVKPLGDYVVLKGVVTSLWTWIVVFGLPWVCGCVPCFAPLVNRSYVIVTYMEGHSVESGNNSLLDTFKLVIIGCFE